MKQNGVDPNRYIELVQHKTYLEVPRTEPKAQPKPQTLPEELQPYFKLMKFAPQHAVNQKFFHN